MPFYYLHACFTERTFSNYRETCQSWHGCGQNVAGNSRGNKYLLAQAYCWYQLSHLWHCAGQHDCFLPILFNLTSMIQTVKSNKEECIKMTEHTYELICAIINICQDSTVELSAVMIRNIGQFSEWVVDDCLYVMIVSSDRVANLHPYSHQHTWEDSFFHAPADWRKHTQAASATCWKFFPSSVLQRRIETCTECFYSKECALL